MDCREGQDDQTDQQIGHSQIDKENSWGGSYARGSPKGVNDDRIANNC